MSATKQLFLRDQVLFNAINASLQRAFVYTPDASFLERRQLWKCLREALIGITETYSQPVPEEAHIQNIVNLADTISGDCSNFLVNGRFRIGNAQKALNLYLKYLWCLEQIPMPPHCPFDSRIISRLSKDVQVSWTRLDDIDSYRALVDAAKDVAGRLSLAEWELQVYQESFE